VLAVSATVVINVRLMFLSPHDTAVVLIALSTAVALAVVGAWLVTRRVMAGFHRLGAGVDRLVADHDQQPSTDAQPGSRPEPTGDDSLPAELTAALADLAEARRAIAESRRRERAAEQARRELVSFMSHDLRTPLAGLRALSEGLEDGVIADVPRALSHLRTTVSRMTVLVDDLFALSRVQGTVDAKERRQVSLAEVINDVASEAAATAESARVDLSVDVAAGDRLAVLGNHDDLTRAFANLVANAIRHTDAGLGVFVRAGRADDGAIMVAVVDQCGGIPPEHLARVFDTGWRGNSSRTSADGGAGLGLAIAHGVVSSHDGRIEVRNTADGCSFEVELPSSAMAGR
jgi:signal transduction histidine kinase